MPSSLILGQSNTVVFSFKLLNAAESRAGRIWFVQSRRPFEADGSMGSLSTGRWGRSQMFVD